MFTVFCQIKKKRFNNNIIVIILNIFYYLDYTIIIIKQTEK